MKASTSPVTYANRAKLTPARFSVCTHVPERIVILNIYHANDDTSVLEMTADEAREIAAYFAAAADRLAQEDQKTPCAP